MLVGSADASARERNHPKSNIPNPRGQSPRDQGQFHGILNVIIRKMICASLVFFRCSPNYNIAFKITRILQVNIDNIKFNNDYKNYITVRKTLEEYLSYCLLYNNIATN